MYCLHDLICVSNTGHYSTMTDSWEYEKLVENQDDLARAMGANKGIALSVATKLVAKKVVSDAAKELADVRGPDVTERLRATSVINIGPSRKECLFPVTRVWLPTVSRSVGR